MKRTRVIFCASAALMLTMACTSGSKFKVEGSVQGDMFDSQTAYLLRGTERVDSAVVANGHFTFSGTVAEPWIGTVAMNAQGNGYVKSDFVVEHGTITLDVITDELAGTPLNDQLAAFAKSIRVAEQEEEMNTLTKQYYAATDPIVRAEAERKYDSVEALYTQHSFDQAMDLYKANADNVLGAYAAGFAAGLDKMNYAELNAMMKQASDVVKNYAPLTQKLEQLRAIDQTSAGRHYTDIQGVDGRLSDLIDGKLALVDFYASWCGPCRNEIRDNLVPLWAKYQKKGLVIVGLNVWERGNREQREAAHQKVMAELGITYPQLVDSTRTATDTYGVRGIPQIMLIDRDGTILARDLRGDAIEEAIIKAL